MSYFHKAHVFAWRAFESELAPTLHRALTDDDREPLLAFVQLNRARCRDLIYGEPLTDNWRHALTAGVVQEAADLAVTAYYDLNSDFGLGDAWGELDELLPPRVRAALLGTTFGPPARPFDPGRMGSYFQSEHEAAQSLRALRRYTHPVLARVTFRTVSRELRDYTQALASALEPSLGLFVTF